MSKDTPQPKRSNNAPYNFVPLCRHIMEPEWAPLVSHDLPMEDGISGEFCLDIEAVTPLLVGGRQKGATDKAPGEVHFFETPDGHAIPGSSLRGMIRNVFEIATFSKMSNVDDTRFGLRDISGGYVSASYKDFFVEKRGPDGRKNLRSRSVGFMSMSPEGGPRITPCSMTRLHKETIAKWLTGRDGSFFRAGMTVREKYEAYQKAVKKAGKGDWSSLAFDIDRDTSRAANLGRGRERGFPVFTGQISNNKKKDFIFYNEDPNQAFLVREKCARAWRDFLFIHGDEANDPKMSWPGYWRDVYQSGGNVPVFYVQSGNRVPIALAFLPKLAGDFSVHDTIGHAGRHHLDADMIDMTELLFGRVAEKPEDAIKSRVWFEMGLPQNKTTTVRLPPTILNGPKASYFPNYLEQGDVEKSGQYATYMRTPKNPRPVARGWKRYVAKDGFEIQSLAPDQEDNKNVQVILNPVESGARFRSRVVFHNITPIELGALLWSASFGQDPQHLHGLGMGKPFGLGQTRVTVDEASFAITPNSPDSEHAAHSIDDFIAAFVAYADDRLQGASFVDTPQIRSLRAMANPKSPDRHFNGELRHMVLTMKNNEFNRAKQRGDTLQTILGERTAAPIRINPAPDLVAPPAQSSGGATSESGRITELQRAYEERLEKNDKTSTGGPMIDLRASLLEDAQSWESESLRLEAAQLIRKTVKLKGWSKKKKAASTELLNKLENKK